MSVADIVGTVDAYSAATAVAFAAGLTVVATSAIVRWQNSSKLRMDFEVEKLKLSNADAANARNWDVDREVKLGQIAANKQIEVTRIESGMVDVKTAQHADQA